MVPDFALHRLRTRVLQAALGEDDSAVGEHPPVIGVVVALGVAELLLRPGLAVVVGLADVEVASLGTVPRDVNVLARGACGDLRLVGPGDVAVDVDRRRPRPAVVSGLRERGREAVVAVAVEQRRVDGAGVRDDLDHRVVLRLNAEAEAERDLRAEARAAIGGDRQRDERRGAVARAAGRDDAVARRQEVDPRRLWVSRDRWLPIVGVQAEQARADPAARRPCRLLCRSAERAARQSLDEGVHALRRQLVLVLRLERAAARR